MSKNGEMSGRAPQEVAHATLKGGTALANIANSCASGYPAVAEAHAVLARPCVLKSAMQRSAALANIMNSCAFG